MTTRCFTVVFKCSPSLFKVENFFCCINLLWSVTLRWKSRFTVIYCYILHLHYSSIIHPQAFESKHCFITQLEVTGYFMVLDISVSRLWWGRWQDRWVLPVWAAPRCAGTVRPLKPQRNISDQLANQWKINFKKMITDESDDSFFKHRFLSGFSQKRRHSGHCFSNYLIPTCKLWAGLRSACYLHFVYTCKQQCKQHNM